MKHTHTYTVRRMQSGNKTCYIAAVLLLRLIREDVKFGLEGCREKEQSCSDIQYRQYADAHMRTAHACRQIEVHLYCCIVQVYELFFF